MNKSKKIIWSKQAKEVNNMIKNNRKNIRKEATASNNNQVLKTNNIFGGKNMKKNIKKETTAINNNQEFKTVNKQETAIVKTSETSACTDLTALNSTPMPDRVTESKCIRAVVNTKTNPLLMNIPEDDMAVGSKKEAERMKAVLDLLSQSSAYGTVNIQNALGDRIYAGVTTDEKGIRTIEFYQLYNDGSFSSKVEILQSDLMTTQMCHLSNSTNACLKKKVQNIELKISNEYLGKFRGEPEEILDINAILFTLFTVLPSLPEQTENHARLMKQDFYHCLREQIRSTYISDEHKSYYALTDENIIEMAKSMKMSRTAFLDRLLEYGFLYLTSSSQGYQTNVKESYPDGTPYTVWKYCIYKLPFLAGIDEDSDMKCSYEF